MLDNVEIAQEHVDLLAPAADPGTTVHYAPQRPRRTHDTACRERGEFDRASIIDTEIPVTSRIVGPECT